MSEKNKYYCADLSDFADEFGVRAEEVLLEKIAAVQQKREVSYYEGVLVPCVRSGVHNKGLRLGCTVVPLNTAPPNTATPIFKSQIWVLYVIYDSQYRRFQNIAAFSPVPRSAVLRVLTVL